MKFEFEKFGGSIAMDGWMDSQTKTAYFGLTAHYISEGTDGQLVLNDRILVIRELSAERAKSGEYLREELDGYLSEFKLTDCTRNNLVFLSDRGTNMATALRGLENSHCFAHMLNNALYRIFKKERNKSVSEHNWAYRMMHHATAIVKYFKASALCKQFTPTLQSNVCTRWNSVYNMLCSVIRHYEKICDMLRASGNRLDDLNAITLEELQILVEFLKPFKNSTDEIEATHHPTLHKVIPNFMEISVHLENKPSDPACIIEIKEIVSAYWHGNIVNYLTIYHKLALFLHPIAKSLRTFTIDEKNIVVDRAMQMMHNFMPTPVTATATATEQQKRSRPTTKRDSAMRFCVDDSDSDRDEFSVIEIEVQDYRQMKVRGTPVDDVLLWWREHRTRFPRLYGVARFIHSIPASSAAAERLFSTAGRLVAFRPHMRSTLVDEILFLKSNLDLSRQLQIQGEEIDEDQIETISLNDESDEETDE